MQNGYAGTHAIENVDGIVTVDFAVAFFYAIDSVESVFTRRRAQETQPAGVGGGTIAQSAVLEQFPPSWSWTLRVHDQDFIYSFLICNDNVFFKNIERNKRND